jgi:type II secretory pathway pseudopilin PulG
MRQRGFTIIELFALILLIFIIGIVFWTQKNNIETAARDDKRKTSINAMYYGLEEAFYPANKFYPKTLTEATLPSVDPAALKDPRGVKIGQANSDYSYEGKGCTDDKCKSYTLRARLDNEADFVKDSRNN